MQLCFNSNVGITLVVLYPVIAIECAIFCLRHYHLTCFTAYLLNFLNKINKIKYLSSISLRTTVDQVQYENDRTVVTLSNVAFSASSLNS